MSRFLTLSIQETQKDLYKVVVYEPEEKQFYALSIRNRDFRTAGGEVLWDIFGLTEARLELWFGEFYRPQGRVQLVEQYSKQKMKDFLESHLTRPQRFIHGSMTYAFLKADRVVKLYQPVVKDKMQQKVELRINREYFPPWLIKDYRWLCYWRNLPEHLWPEKLEHWKDYLNDPARGIYLVMYRHVFPNKNKQVWISGFHCL